MDNKFKDYFSENSEEYNRFRPKYPIELFTYLSSISNQHEIAWDCATGTGQSALSLSGYFLNVVATDASTSQIKNADKKHGITYHVATAENSHIEENSIDLITVAQAFHWFNIEAFSKEVNRVLKDQGFLAIWSYSFLSIQEEIDNILFYLYNTTLNDYWPKERKMVEDGYNNVQLPFKDIEHPEFEMSAQWNFSQLMGYLSTWSASKKYQKITGINPLGTIQDEISKIWGSPDKVLLVKWPLSLRIWQKKALA